MKATAYHTIAATAEFTMPDGYADSDIESVYVKWGDV